MTMRIAMRSVCLATGLAAPLLSAQAAQPPVKNPEAAVVEIVGHVLEPRKMDATSERIASLRVPSGFDVTVFARDLINPRMIAADSNGRVYVTRRTVGDVVLLQDTNGDGVADGEPRIVANRPNMHGIAITGDTVYLVTVKELYRTRIMDDGALAPLELLLDDLPDGGQHPNRTIVVGPDAHLYLSVGSTCNACTETNPESATMLRVAPDGSSRTIFASGLRNTIGFGFEPRTREMFGMDHGIDWLGDNVQHEELNHIAKGATYGWPYVYGDGQFNPQDNLPGGITMEEWAARSVNPIALHTPHAAPMQMTFYTGNAFPAQYRGSAFVAMRGSWNRRPPSGYEVVHIRFNNGRPTAIEPFLQGFLSESDGDWSHFGRLAGLAMTADGALLVSDDANGMVYRIAYIGNTTGRATPVPWNSEDNSGPRFTGAPPKQPPTNAANELAGQILVATATLRVSSPAFADQQAIPAAHSAEGENISPALTWTAGPAGTQSYVVIMEDPDVAQDPPFVHWLLYNVPAGITQLEQAVPGGPAVARLEKAMQGPNDYGSMGYYGPRPPKEDPPHAYHFQVFALDSTLDLPFGATRAELLEAMSGHVLAVGALVGTFER